MKRYWLFQSNKYEASGGLGDLDAIGDDIDELKKQAQIWDSAWIVDTQTWTTIVEGHKHWMDSEYEWVNVNETVEILQGEK